MDFCLGISKTLSRKSLGDFLFCSKNSFSPLARLYLSTCAFSVALISGGGIIPVNL